MVPIASRWHVTFTRRSDRFILGYYGWLALAAPPPPTYYLDFGSTQWIQASEPSNNVCFRKNLYLSAVPRYAWLQIVAIDGFTVSVNGKHLSFGQAAEPELESEVLSWNAGGNQSVISDITHYLAPGKNTIAVNVTRGSFPGRAKLVCRGAVLDQTGKFSEFSSDNSWRVALTPGTIPALISWTDSKMDDARWAHAEETASERSAYTQPVTGTAGPFPRSCEGEVDHRRASEIRRQYDVPETL